VEAILKRHNVVQLTWAGDGSMSSFAESQHAVDAVIEFLKTLDNFNREKNRLSKPFRPRCGIHTGDIYADESTPIEHISSIEIDIAGHLQKTSEPDGLLISETTLSEITNARDFHKLTDEVDGQKVWKYGTATDIHDHPAVPPLIRSPKEEQRLIARKILASLYDAWAKHTIISLNHIREESNQDKGLFHTVVEILEDRGLIKSYGTSYTYEITPDGVYYSEDNSVVAEDAANWHRNIRNHILTFLSDLYEREGSRADAHYEKIAEGGLVDRLGILIDLSLLTKIGYVEATSINTFRVTFEGLRFIHGDDYDEII
jgi:predicted transcriptional regulator